MKLALSINPLADPSNPSSEINLSAATGLGTVDPTTTISRIINWGLTILGLLFLCLVLYGGIYWMLARGDEEKVSKAKNIIRAAIIGLVIVLASYGISKFVFTYLVNITNAPRS